VKSVRPVGSWRYSGIISLSISRIMKKISGQPIVKLNERSQNVFSSISRKEIQIYYSRSGTVPGTVVLN